MNYQTTDSEKTPGLEETRKKPGCDHYATPSSRIDYPDYIDAGPCDDCHAHLKEGHDNEARYAAGGETPPGLWEVWTGGEGALVVLACDLVHAVTSQSCVTATDGLTLDLSSRSSLHPRSQSQLIIGSF